MQALLRRADARRRPGRLRVVALEVDVAARVVRLRGALVDLSQKEFALARTLASDPTRVFTKDQLLRTIWGFRAMGSNRCRARHPWERPSGAGMSSAARRRPLVKQRCRRRASRVGRCSDSSVSARSGRSEGPGQAARRAGSDG